LDGQIREADSMSVSMSHNIGDVIRDVDDVGDDLRAEMRKRVGRAMDTLEAGVNQYIIRDPNYSTKLLRNIDSDTDVSASEIDFRVFVNTNMADYAAVVEYGSGARTNKSFPKGGNEVPSRWPDDGSETPSGYPYDAPDIDFNFQNPYDMDGYDDFYGFVKTIEEWMRTKPVQPLFSFYVSAVLIAKEVLRRGNYAHPYMRPAWFDNRPLIIKAAKTALKNATR